MIYKLIMDLLITFFSIMSVPAALYMLHIVLKEFKTDKGKFTLTSILFRTVYTLIALGAILNAVVKILSFLGYANEFWFHPLVLTRSLNTSILFFIFTWGSVYIQKHI